MDWIIPCIVIFLSLPLMNILATSIHEAGHAIPALMFTNEQVVVFLGSHGRQEGCRRISFGRLEVWFKLNVFAWKGGICKSSHNISLRQRVIVIIAGPIASLVLFATLLTVDLVFRPNGLWAPFLFIFCIWSGLVFLYNIVPRGGRIDTGGSDLLHSDGTKLQMILEDKRMPPEYKEAVELVGKGNYEEAAAILERIIESGTKNAQVYRMAVGAYMKLRNYRRADQVQNEQVTKIGNIDAHDRINMALLKMLLGKNEEAVSYYQHLLRMGGANKYNLNNFGFLLTRLERFEEAIPYLDKAIGLDKNYAYAYSNRAYAKMMLGQLEEGKADNDISMSLNSRNSYVYRNLGIYLFQTGSYQQALAQLNKAREMDPDTWMVDYFIQRTMNWLESE